MANGYMGKTLWVDLTEGKLHEEELDDKVCRDFIGGYGLAAKVLFNHMKAGIDPLGPENIFGIVTSPLTGTPAVGGSRYVVVGKSPLTGGWGDANSGGVFGPKLKFAGFDAVYFTGISSKPVYLFIDNGKAELRDAGNLWGKDTFVTEDLLKDEIGKDVEVACIGPSGENISLIAAVMNNKGRAAARSGLGAIMGSKKLKAVVVRGDLKVPLADEEKAKELRKKHLSELTGHFTVLREFGTPAIFIPLSRAGDSPIKNFGGVQAKDFPEVELLGAEAVVAEQEKRYACYQCPIACGGRMKESTGEYQYGTEAHKPEYETLAMFGSNCLNNNLASIIKVNDICNRAGIDTISAGSAIAMAMECYEKGIISKEDTDGLEMTWGNHQAIVAMTEKLANRDGFGDLLADGVKAAAEKIGKGADQYAMHIQGQEIPAHDPKYGFHWAIGYRLDATPARHPQAPGIPVAGLPAPMYDKTSQLGSHPAYKMRTNFMHVVQSLGMCKFVYWAYAHTDSLLEMINAVTGWDVTYDELFLTGERINTIRHSFNVREGINALEYKVPSRIIGSPPFAEGPLKGVTLDIEGINNEYVAAMDWDPKSAKPSKEKLAELGLEEVAEALWA